MTKTLKLRNKRFGYLTVIERAGNAGGHNGHALWRCQCDCGQMRVVRSDHLKRGRVKSCCLNGHRWRGALPASAQ